MIDYLIGFKIGVGFFCAYLVMCLALNASGKILRSRDDSDPVNGRSSLEVLTDHKTGLQYLRSTSGLSPRLDVNGKQMRVES